MKRAKAKGTKLLTLRKDLSTTEAKTFFKEDDIFFVDDTEVLYDYRNNPFYPAETKFGEKGYVITTGIEIISEGGRKHGQHIKNSS